MSRVRSALRRADDWDGKSVFTGEAERLPAIGTFGPSKRIVLTASSIATAAAAQAAEDEAPGSQSGKWNWWRRLRRKFFRSASPVPKCSGTTRRGHPCRAPAMDNGYCRMHGGERRVTIADRVPGSALARLLARLRPGGVSTGAD